MKQPIAVTLIAASLCLPGCHGNSSNHGTDSYQGVAIGDNKTKVLKSLGLPSIASDEKVHHLKQEDNHPLIVNPDIPAGPDYPGIPAGREDRREFIGSLNRYDSWTYDPDNITDPTFILQFDTITDKITSIECWVAELKSLSCDPLMGVDSFSMRADVLKQLGQPEVKTDKTEKNSEVFDYPSKGVEIIFNGDGRVGMLIRKARVTPLSHWLSLVSGILRRGNPAAKN